MRKIVTALVIIWGTAYADNAKLTWGAVEDDCKNIQIQQIKNYSGSGWDTSKDTNATVSCETLVMNADIGEGVLYGWRLKIRGKNGLNSAWSNIAQKTGARTRPKATNLKAE